MNCINVSCCMRQTGALLAVLLLAGCRLLSDRPLLDQEAGQAIFGERVAVLAVDHSGRTKISDKGDVTYMDFRRVGSRYVTGNPEAPSKTLTMHRIDGVPYDVAQLTTGRDGKTHYVLLRKEARRLEVALIDLDKLTKEAVERNRFTVTEEGVDDVVADHASLVGTIRLWSQINAAKLKDGEAFDRYFALSQNPKDVQNLQYQAASAMCLARAGHGLDPKVQELAKKHRDGKLLEDIEPSAREICQMAVSLGNSPSVRYALVRTMIKDEDYAAADPLISALQAEGFALAFVMEADLLARGAGRTKDPAAARRLLEQQAGRGNPVVDHYLGYFHMFGLFGKADYPAAARSLEIGHRGGIAASAALLGVLYEDGFGVKKDKARAAALYAEAAKNGDLYGTLLAGKAAYFGTGRVPDREEAYGLLKSAAERGSAEAQYFTGFMLANGQGVRKNENLAVSWLRKASDAGNVAAKAELGRMLVAGVGIEPDTEQGMVLLKEAAEAGSKTAKKYLEKLDDPLAGVTGIPADRQRDMGRLARQKSFKLTEENIPFMAGVGTSLMQRCGVPKAVGERAELAKFVMTATVGSTLGSQYSNPDLGAGVGNMIQRQALQATGEKVGQQIACGAVADRIAKGIVAAIRSNSQGDDGGPSRFVSSCTPHFDARRCACLGDTGRAVIPNLHRMAYDRSLIKRIIEGNPFIGLQVAMSCGIVEY